MISGPECPWQRVGGTGCTGCTGPWERLFVHVFPLPWNAQVGRHRLIPRHVNSAGSSRPRSLVTQTRVGLDSAREFVAKLG